jgi:hypothetical protein
VFLVGEVLRSDVFRQQNGNVFLLEVVREKRIDTEFRILTSSENSKTAVFFPAICILSF